MDDNVLFDDVNGEDDDIDDVSIFLYSWWSIEFMRKKL